MRENDHFNASACSDLPDLDRAHMLLNHVPDQLFLLPGRHRLPAATLNLLSLEFLDGGDFGN
jgi:hypothetical protein